MKPEAERWIVGDNLTYFVTDQTLSGVYDCTLSREAVSLLPCTKHVYEKARAKSFSLLHTTSVMEVTQTLKPPPALPLQIHNSFNTTR
jgi:hypothetical protein